MNTLNNFFFLPESSVLVRGAKYSLLMNFNDGKTFRLNNSASKIIELGEKGLNISEIVKSLQDETDSSDAISFMKKLSAAGLAKISADPKPSMFGNIESISPEFDFLWIEVTSKCNLRCIHCYADANDPRDQEISKEDIKRVIDDAASLGWKRLQFTGGECTLRKDLPLLISHAKSRGFEFIEVFTNGTMLTESLIKFFAEEGVSVGMSLYSYQAETHDAITQVPGSFDKVLNSLKLLLAYGVPTRCATVAMKQNEADLIGTSYLMCKLGVFRRLPDPIRPSGRGRSMEHWPIEYGRQSIQAQPNFEVKREIFEKNKLWNCCWCGKAGVTSSGDVLPCLFARDHIAGNINEQSLAEIVSGDAMQEFWSLTMDRIDTCKDCEYRYLCHDCRPWAYGISGNLYAKNPRCTYNPYNGEWGKAEDALLLNNIEHIDILTLKQGCREC